MHCQQRPLDAPDPMTGRSYGWTVNFDDGSSVRWEGLQTGPLTHSAEDVEALCQRLLGHGVDAVPAAADRVLQPATGDKADLPALILHSTTPDLRTFDGDLDALVSGGRGGDFTTYKEARSVYLAGPDDVAVGRTLAWRAAVDALGVEAIDLDWVDHYYLSHALLHLADEYRDGSGSAMDQLVARVRRAPHKVRLYAFEVEMQIFLLWLARTAGVDALAMEANRPALSVAWNRKDVLHPTVARATELGPDLPADPLERLALEGRHCGLATAMDLQVPRVPGYALERAGQTADDFVDQLLAAADLLRRRHGLTTGCLKASESGDGARITPGIDLGDSDTLRRLGHSAHRHGDDYVLEAHVTYGRVAGQDLTTALSAHIRGGRVARGVTLQFMEGTSWKGNVLVDEHSLDAFGISAEHYRGVRDFVARFLDAFERRSPGLVLTGIDFAVGTVGGHFGETPLLGVQDLNVSFTGAECLRAFLDKVARERPGASPHGVSRIYGVTRIYRPKPHADHRAFQAVTRRFTSGEIFADTVASIAGRWGMVGVTGVDPLDALENLGRLEAALAAEDLIP